jgi:hypothetical protein
MAKVYGHDIAVKNSIASLVEWVGAIPVKIVTKEEAEEMYPTDEQEAKE